MRKLLQEQSGNELLRSNIDLELDVVRLGRIDPEWMLKVLPQQFAGGACRPFRGIEVMLHRIQNSRSSQPLNFSSTYKKNREEKLNSPPGLKLRW